MTKHCLWLFMMVSAVALADPTPADEISAQRIACQ